MGIVELVILLARDGGNGNAKLGAAQQAKWKMVLDDDFSKECR